jgi:hypothetical protein
LVDLTSGISERLDPQLDLGPGRPLQIRQMRQLRRRLSRTHLHYLKIADFLADAFQQALVRR